MVAHAAFGAATVVRCGRLLDVAAGVYKTNVDVTINDGIIIGVAAAKGAADTDLSALTCLPGLIDAHDHLTSDPQNSGYKSLGISVPRMALTGAKNARLTLEAGFTTVRNLGARGFADVAFGDAI